MGLGNHSSHRPPVVGDPSPWGRIQSADRIAVGIVSVTTSGHGGLWLSDSCRDAMDPVARSFARRWSKGWGDRWWEEDCAAALVVARFPEPFSLSPDALARCKRFAAETLERHRKAMEEDQRITSELQRSHDPDEDRFLP